MSRDWKQNGRQNSWTWIKKDYNLLTSKSAVSLTFPSEHREGRSVGGVGGQSSSQKRYPAALWGAVLKHTHIQIRGTKHIQIICSEPFKWFVVFYVLQTVQKVYNCFVSTEIFSFLLFNSYCYCKPRNSWQLPERNKFV